ELQPPVAALDFVGIRPLVQPQLAALLMLEMLDRIGDEDRFSRDACVLERAVQHTAGWPDEWFPREVLSVAGLLAHQHELRALFPFARHDLGGIAVKRAAPTLGLGVPQFAQ